MQSINAHLSVFIDPILQKSTTLKKFNAIGCKLNFNFYIYHNQISLRVLRILLIIQQQLEIILTAVPKLQINKPI